MLNDISSRKPPHSAPLTVLLLLNFSVALRASNTGFHSVPRSGPAQPQAHTGFLNKLKTQQYRAELGFSPNLSRAEMKFTDDRQSLAPGELMAEAVPRPSLQDFQPSPGPGTLVTGAAEGLASSIALAAAAPLPPCQASRLHVALGRLCFTVFNPPTKTLPFPPLPGA